MSAVRALLGTALLVLHAGCERAAQPHAVGTLERDRIELSADSTEPIVDIAVAEGDRVQAGAVLVVQDPARAEIRLAQARAGRERAVAQLAEVVAGPRAEAIARAEARLAAADSAVTTAGHELRREQALAAREFASRNQLDLLQGRYDAALAGREEARAALDELQAGTRSEVVQRARETLAGAEARVRELELALRRTRITAPLDGTVEALPLEIGERPHSGAPVVVLRARGPTFARVYVPEPLRTRLRIGSPAEIRLDGYATAFAGRIRWISAEAAFTPYFALTQRDRSRLAYAAEVLLDTDQAAALPAGVPVEVRFPEVPR